MRKRQGEQSGFRPLPGRYKTDGRAVIVFSAAHPVYNWLSNMSSSPFELSGKNWATVEHFYQASKSLNPAESEAIRLTETPFLAKRLGGSRAITLRPGWDEMRPAVMLEGLRAKFEQNLELRAKLAETADVFLIEGTRDPYWGCGSDGQGQNQLGHLLMRVRAELSA